MHSDNKKPAELLDGSEKLDDDISVRTSDHPVSVSLKPGSPNKPDNSNVELAKNMFQISSISFVIAYLVRRNLYSKIRDFQPDDLPFTIPPDTGSALAGAAVVATYFLSKEKTPRALLNRRRFLHVVSGAAGAYCGAKIADVLDTQVPGRVANHNTEKDAGLPENELIEKKF